MAAEPITARSVISFVRPSARPPDPPPASAISLPPKPSVPSSMRHRTAMAALPVSHAAADDPSLSNPCHPMIDDPTPPDQQPHASSAARRRRDAGSKTATISAVLPSPSTVSIKLQCPPARSSDAHDQLYHAQIKLAAPIFPIFVHPSQIHSTPLLPTSHAQHELHQQPILLSSTLQQLTAVASTTIISPSTSVVMPIT
ncbi:hypothetical protein ACLOJK_027455, partial [Asimina triloba]